VAQGPPLQHDATAQAPMERVEQTIHGTRGLGNFGALANFRLVFLDFQVA
jgi:hypothetical protein